jgi:hypothetical protein
LRSTRRPRHTLCVIPLDQAINARQAQRSVALLKARAVVVTGDAMALELAEPERYPVAAVRHDVVRDDSGGDQPALETFGAQRLGAKLMEAPFLPDHRAVPALRRLARPVPASPTSRGAGRLHTACWASAVAATLSVVRQACARRCHGSQRLNRETVKGATIWRNRPGRLGVRHRLGEGLRQRLRSVADGVAALGRRGPQHPFDWPPSLFPLGVARRIPAISACAIQNSACSTQSSVRLC